MTLKRFVCVIIAVCSISTCVLAQNAKEDLKVFLRPDKFYRKYFPHLRIKNNPVDTAYIKAYPNYVTVGVHILSPALYVTITPRNSAGGDKAVTKFRTSVADVIGFSASYRKVSAGFAFLSNNGLQMHNNYAPSSYHTATIKYNSPVYSLQFKYLKLKGFTDVNTPDNTPYNKRSDVMTKEFQFDGVYNFNWKKYSYMAPLTFSQRQVKSHAGILLKGGVYYKKLGGDSALINQSKREFYGSFNTNKGIQTFSIKLAPGVGGTFVLYKRIYLSGAIFPSFDLYFYKYFNALDVPSGRKESVVFSLDGFASVGYQSRRIYAGLRYEIDRRNAMLNVINMNVINSFAGLEVGYRFDAPRIVQRFYKKTMPPGM